MLTSFFYFYIIAFTLIFYFIICFPFGHSFFFQTPTFCTAKVAKVADLDESSDDDATELDVSLISFIQVFLI